MHYDELCPTSYSQTRVTLVDRRRTKSREDEDARGQSAAWPRFWRLVDACCGVDPGRIADAFRLEYAAASGCVCGLGAGTRSVVYFATSPEEFEQRADMTMLKGDVARPGSHSELISPTPLLLLASNEPRAPIANLSLAKRDALVACINAGRLYKKAGAWHGPFGGRPLAGVTIADLARDGMLTVTTNHRLGSAQLTGRGKWFARTLLHDAETANLSEWKFAS